MKKLLTILLIAFSWSTGFTQTENLFSLEKVIIGDIAAFTVDNLGNIYLLSSTNQVKKLNAQGDSVAVYNNVKKFGQASLIDVSNPLKILLYYPDFATIVVLDRLLNARNTIELRKSGILQVRAIGQSYDNKVWVYDEVDNKLKKIDEDGKLSMETPDFRQLFDQAPSPQKIFDQDQYVYLYDTAQGIFVFDYYGTLKNRIPVPGWHNLKVTGKYIFGSSASQLFRYDLNTSRINEWALPAALNDSKAFNFSNSRLFALKKDRLEIYSFQ